MTQLPPYPVNTHIVTCIPIARQRLGKHICGNKYAGNNRKERPVFREMASVIKSEVTSILKFSRRTEYM
jgi:hypothetical protein